MKKLICMLLCAVVLLSVTVSIISASEKGRVYINDISASSGDTVVVSVMVESVAACCGGSFNIVYDHTLLEVVSCTKGTAMEGIAPNIRTDYAEDKIRVNWLSNNVLGDGSICDVTLKVKDTADTAAFIRIEGLKLSDIDGNSITAECTSGYVVIGEGSLVVTDVGLYDFENNRTDTLGAGSNQIRVEVHNTLSVKANPLVAFVLYEDGEIASVYLRAANHDIGQNETAVVEQTVNVPMGSGCELKVIVWDGVLNVRQIKDIMFAGE